MFCFLLIQNNMLNLIVVKFLSSFDCYAVNSGYKLMKGRFVQQKFFKQQLSSVNFVSAVFSQIIRHFLHRYQNNAPWLPGCLDYRPFFCRLSCTIDVILSDIANVLQIWSTPYGYEELVGEFEPIRNRKIFWVKDKRVNSLASCANYSSLPVFEGTKPQVTLKLKGHSFFFLVDKEGEFLQPTLFDKTVGMKRF